MCTTHQEIRRLPIEMLKPAAYNPRRVLAPDSPAYRKLESSLREFGLVEPLVWNEVSGHVVGGHARLQILRALGCTEVPVSVVRLDSVREKALNVVLNNREAQGQFDAAKLADLLTALSGLPELALTGFAEQDLATLRMAPVESLAFPENGPEMVEITIVADSATYERIAPRLNAIMGELDLVCHVRNRPAKRS